MTIKKRIKSKVLLALRKIGMLCKKPIKTTRYIKVSKTILPSGNVINHYRITSLPKNESDLESAIHIHNEIKNLVSK